MASCRCIRQFFEVGGVIASVKVASEAKLVEAGSSIVGGLDRVFKLFWIMNMAYPAKCCNIFTHSCSRCDHHPPLQHTLAQQAVNLAKLTNILPTYRQQVGNKLVIP